MRERGGAGGRRGGGASEDELSQLFLLHSKLTPELRVTKDTDLGDNETIKAPKPMPITPFPNRNRRRRKCGE